MRSEVRGVVAMAKNEPVTIETIVVPDTVEVTSGYYEDTTQPIVEAPANDLDFEDDYHLEEVTIPINSLLSTEGIQSAANRTDQIAQIGRGDVFRVT